MNNPFTVIFIIIQQAHRPSVCINCIVDTFLSDSYSQASTNQQSYHQCHVTLNKKNII
jgi:hypothetical protein